MCDVRVPIRPFNLSVARQTDCTFIQMTLNLLPSTVAIDNSSRRTFKPTWMATRRSSQTNIKRETKLPENSSENTSLKTFAALYC